MRIEAFIEGTAITVSVVCHARFSVIYMYNSLNLPNNPIRGVTIISILQNRKLK